MEIIKIEFSNSLITHVQILNILQGVFSKSSVDNYGGNMIQQHNYLVVVIQTFCWQ